MQFFFSIEPDGDGFLATSLDVPEAITGGANDAEIRANIQEALDLALCAYASQGRAQPEGGRKDPEASRFIVMRPSASAMAKIAFIEAFRASGMTRTALAERLGKRETEVRRMLDPGHATKLANLEAGLMALGKRYTIGVEELA